MERLHAGWLTKSPPEYKTQRIFPAKWRRRYFALYVPPSSGTLPGKACRAILDYYSSEKMQRKRGSIDLEKCHSISAINSVSVSPCFKHIFVMKTVHKDKERDYYLASDSKEEMDAWVDILCGAVGLSKDSRSLPNFPKAREPVQSALSSIPNKKVVYSSSSSSPSPFQTFPKRSHPGTAGDYLDLTQCVAGAQAQPGRGDVSSPTNATNGVNPKIQIYQLPSLGLRNQVSSESSSGRTDSNDFQGDASPVYNVPKSAQPSNNEYKLPKTWHAKCCSTSSGLDDSFHREDFRSPSSSSTSSAAFIDIYDVPPPKNHSHKMHDYANTAAPSLLRDAKTLPQPSPHEVPLPLKVKVGRNRDVPSHHDYSASLDAFKKHPQNAPFETSSPSSSSSSSSSSEDETSKPDDDIGAVYSLPRHATAGREILPSVFDDNEVARPPVQTVQYLDIDFDSNKNHAAPSKPTAENRVEYREIDFEKTKALTETRVTREITKSQ